MVETFLLVAIGTSLHCGHIHYIGGRGADRLIRSKFKVRNIYSFISIVLALYKFNSSSSSSI